MKKRVKLLSLIMVGVLASVNAGIGGVVMGEEINAIKAQVEEKAANSEDVPQNVKDTLWAIRNTMIGYNGLSTYLEPEDKAGLLYTNDGYNGKLLEKRWNQYQALDDKYKRILTDESVYGKTKELLFTYHNAYVSFGGAGVPYAESELKVDSEKQETPKLEEILDTEGKTPTKNVTKNSVKAHILGLSGWRKQAKNFRLICAEEATCLYCQEYDGRQLTHKEGENCIGREHICPLCNKVGQVEYHKEQLCPNKELIKELLVESLETDLVAAKEAKQKIQTPWKWFMEKIKELLN